MNNNAQIEQAGPGFHVADPRILLSLLTIQAVGSTPSPRESSPRGFSPDGLSWDDVAMALAMVKHPVAALLLRVKWGDQEQYRMDLEEACFQMAYNLFSENQWKFRTGVTLERLVQMALDEVIYPRVCPRCKGYEGEDGRTVVRNRRGVTRECSECGGSGVGKTPSGRERAQQLGVRKTQWFEKWELRFERLVSCLLNLESVALQSMRKNLKER